ncbi:hypothetical protein [Salipiger aestuarii]|uniref:hypothetical protein n=1 Tax=Salipiger aestuarii TaxID=568098 RepID=UPI0012662B8F|nr:hypothetical protein [Salipiger aestuarii]
MSSIEVFCDKRVSIKTTDSAEPIYEKRHPAPAPSVEVKSAFAVRQLAPDAMNAFRRRIPNQ